MNPSLETPGNGISMSGEGDVGGTFQAPKASLPPCRGLLLPSICWGEAFIQTFPGVVNRLRAERGVRVKGGSREQDTRVHAHSHTRAERERQTGESCIPSEKCVGLGSGRESDKRRTKRETEMGLWRGSAMREVDQRGKRET